MLDMREIKQWGEEAEELVKKRKETEQPKQNIKFGKNTISVKKGEPLNMSYFMK